MSEALIKEIARKIATDEISVWPLYLLMAAIVIVCIYFNSLISSFAKRKGVIVADKAEFDELQRQLRENTKTTKAIEIAVSHDDWVIREWKALRQKKLEELLQSIYQADHWQCISRDATLFNSGKDPGPTPLSSVQLLSALYFPELKEPIENFVEANKNLGLCVSVNKPRFEAIPMHLREEVLRNSLNEKWNPLYNKQTQMIEQLEARCSELVATWYMPNKQIQRTPGGAAD